MFLKGLRRNSYKSYNKKLKGGLDLRHSGAFTNFCTMPGNKQKLLILNQWKHLSLPIIFSLMLPNWPYIGDSTTCPMQTTKNMESHQKLTGELLNGQGFWY